jgi:transcriptional regulator with XRE-family HTH domain
MPTRPPNPLRAAAALSGETLAEVARAVGISPDSLYPISAGDRVPWPALRRRLAEHFGYDPFERRAEEAVS